jgi:hypothetical protein
VFAKSVSSSTSVATLRKLVNGSELATANLGEDSIAWHADVPNGISAVFSSPAIAPNGKLYVATAGAENTPGNAKVFCFDTGASGEAFWPSFRANPQNTGNVQDNKWTTNATATAVSITTFLPTYSNGLNQAYAVNNAGTAVGFRTYPNSPNSYYGACYWSTTPNSSGNSPFYMNEVYTGDNGFVFGISDANQCVGVEQYFGVWRGVAWSSLTAYPTLLPLPTGFGSSSDAYQICIATSGTVPLAVGDALNSSGFSRAVQWDRSNPSNLGVNLGTLASVSGVNSYAYAVNSRNWVVGKSQTAAGSVYAAFAMPQRQTPQITISDDNLSGGDGAVATAINGINQIAGGSKNGANGEHAWIWQVSFTNSVRTTTKKDLGAISGGTSRAASINNRGHVVGYYTVSGVNRAFIWLPGWTTIKDLRTFLSSSDAANWSQLFSATGITDDGCIVGYGNWSGSTQPTGFCIRVKP